MTALRTAAPPRGRAALYRPRGDCRNAAAHALRYVLAEPRDAAYHYAGRALCALLRRHNTTCVGRTDPRHRAWRRRLHASRRTA